MLEKGAFISDCCFECGYTNISYFISILKKYTGKTILDYKKAHRFPEKSFTENRTACEIPQKDLHPTIRVI